MASGSAPKYSLKAPSANNSAESLPFVLLQQTAYWFCATATNGVLANTRQLFSMRVDVIFQAGSCNGMYNTSVRICGICFNVISLVIFTESKEITQVLTYPHLFNFVTKTFQCRHKTILSFKTCIIEQS